MQFQTTLTARIPRCSCNRCVVRTLSVLLAEKHSRFKLLFEACAIDVLQAAQSIQPAALLVRTDWSTALFESWYAWSICSRLDPIKKEARMQNPRLNRIPKSLVTDFSHGGDEGFNNWNQSTKPAARGLCVFGHYQILFPFGCGKLSLKPLNDCPGKSQKIQKRSSVGDPAATLANRLHFRRIPHFFRSESVDPDAKASQKTMRFFAIP